MRKSGKIICQICGKKYTSIGSLNKHIAISHRNIDPIEYYIEFINPTAVKYCRFCGKPAQFKGFTKGFKINCKDSICVNKSMASFSKEYKMKVDGLSLEEYEKWSIEDRIIKKKNTEEGFKNKRKDDVDFDKKNSRYCKEFWIKKGFDIDEAKKLAYAETDKSRKKMGEILENDPNYMKGKSWVSKDYWIKKGYSEEESISIVSKKQATFSLEKCIEKYGKDKGREIWINRQEKWNKNFKKTNFSKKSQELFWSLLERDSLLIRREPFFATFNNGIKDSSGVNHEIIVRTLESSIKPDFLVGKKIIEFDGIYWHDFKRRNLPENKKREEDRQRKLEDIGYSILRINELEYDTNKEVVIDKCIKFLNND